MKKAITTLCYVGSGLLVASSFDFTHSLTLFLLAGVIPGTSIALTPIEMMSASATAFTVVVLRLTIWPRIARSFFIAAPNEQKKQVHRTRRA